MRSPRLPPLNALRAFEAAARHGSFSRAADELGVTHGAVSKQIRLLEDDLRQPLFRRSVRQVNLTASGRELMAELSPALERIATVAVSLRRAPASQSGVVRINTRPSFALRWLIPHLPRFVRAHPDIEPQVITSTLEPARLPSGSFDVVIRRDLPGGPPAYWPPGVSPRRFMPEAAFPVAPPELLSRCPVQRPEDLARHVLLHTASREQDWRDWLGGVGCVGLRPAGELRFEHQQFTLQAALDGMGIALALAVLAEIDLAPGRLVEVFPQGHRLRLPPYCYGVAASAGQAAAVLGEWLEQEGGDPQQEQPQQQQTGRSIRSSTSGNIG